MKLAFCKISQWMQYTLCYSKDFKIGLAASIKQTAHSHRSQNSNILETKHIALAMSKFIKAYSLQKQMLMDIDFLVQVSKDEVMQKLNSVNLLNCRMINIF